MTLMDDNNGRGIFSLRLLLLFAQSYHYVPLASGQQAGVSLRFGGEILPSDRFVDIDDVLNIGSGPGPTNRNPGTTGINGVALECITDLADCCGTESGSPVRTERGDWYFPDGTTVGFGGGAQFLVNRGPNEIVNGQQFNGSVRLFRRFSGPPGRGRFRCELPNAANPSINQILYVNILNFGSRFDQPHVLASSTGSNMEGEMYSLMCSSTLNSDFDLDPDRLPVNVPAPSFVWSFGPSGSDPLPSGVTDMGTTSSDNITFTSTLQISSLSQCNIGSYTCRLGPGRLMNSTMVTVNGLSPINVSINIEITTSGAKVLGQSGYSLTCGATVTGTANPSITYQWTKNNGTQSQVGADRVLSFSPLRLSDAGRYTCQAAVGPCSITKMDMQDITLQIPTPSTLMLTSNSGNPDDVTVVVGSDLTLTCTLVLNSAIMGFENTLLMVEVQLSRNGTSLAIASRSITGTTFTYTTQVGSFGRSDSGNYTCTATISPQPTAVYLTGNEILSSHINIRAVSSPPVDVLATQSGSSAPVEVSWSPPSDGANSINGYRIYYGNGQNVFVSSVTVITSVSLRVDANYIGQNVSIRSESDQLYSELINVSVIFKDNNEQCTAAMDTAMLSCSCTSEVGIAVGAVIVVVCLVAIVITIIVVLCLWRKKLSMKNKNDSSGNDFAVSANMAYGEVTLKPVAGGVDGGEYENPDKILGTGASTYEPIHSSKPEASEYASVEDTVGTTN